MAATSTGGAAVESLHALQPLHGESSFSSRLATMRGSSGARAPGTPSSSTTTATTWGCCRLRPARTTTRGLTLHQCHQVARSKCDNLLWGGSLIEYRLIKVSQGGCTQGMVL